MRRWKLSRGRFNHADAGHARAVRCRSRIADRFRDFDRLADVHSIAVESKLPRKVRDRHSLCATVDRNLLMRPAMKVTVPFPVAPLDGADDRATLRADHPMPQFSYRARNAQGGLVEGVLNVADRSVAIRQIEQQHCIPIRIEAMSPAGPRWSMAKPPRRSPEPTQNLKIPHGQLLVFTEQLGHLLQAGMTLDESLGVLEKRLKQPQGAADDTRAAPGADRRPQLLAGVARFPAHLLAALYQHGRRGRSERRTPRHSHPRRRAFDAGKKSARSGAAGADLSGLPRPRRLGA